MFSLELLINIMIVVLLDYLRLLLLVLLSFVFHICVNDGQSSVLHGQLQTLSDGPVRKKQPGAWQVSLSDTMKLNH